MIVLSIPVDWLFARAGKLNLVMPLAMSIAVFAFAILVRWPLRRVPWFWATLAGLAAVHAAAIALVAWTDERVPAAATAGAASIDLLLVLAVVAGVEKMIHGGPAGHR